MQYTFEVTIAGCNTECLHCYVGGGKGPLMSFDDYILAANKLNAIFNRLGGDISLMTGNENFLHPDIGGIISHSLAKMPQYFMPDYFARADANIPTTGIALTARRDRLDVLSMLRDAGCRGVMLTLHGNEAHHAEITKNSGSFSAIAQTAELLTGQGFDVSFNLMLSRHLISGWDSVAGLLAAFPGAVRHITIPLYLPVPRLRLFQRYRATYEQCLQFAPRLEQAGLSADAFLAKIGALNEAQIYAGLAAADSFSYAENEKNAPVWAFFNVTPALDLYYGNAGAHTRFLANLRGCSPGGLYEMIKDLPANYDWSVYYDVESLPPIHEVLSKITVRENYVYSSAAECIYSWFDTLNVPDILIP